MIMKKYTLLEIVMLLKKSGTISGNGEMEKWLNKVKKNKKLTNSLLEVISPALVGNHKLNEKIIASLL